MSIDLKQSAIAEIYALERRQKQAHQEQKSLTAIASALGDGKLTPTEAPLIIGDYADEALATAQEIEGKAVMMADMYMNGTLNANAMTLNPVSQGNPASFNYVLDSARRHVSKDYKYIWDAREKDKAAELADIKRQLEIAKQTEQLADKQMNESNQRFGKLIGTA